MSIRSRRSRRSRQRARWLLALAAGALLVAPRGTPVSAQAPSPEPAPSPAAPSIEPAATGEAPEAPEAAETASATDELGLDLPLPPPPTDPAAREAWLVAACDAAVAAAPALAMADVGAVVVDIASGRVLWSRQGDRGLSLASVTKVVTAAAALQALGPGFRWRTTVFADRFDPTTGVVTGDLYVRGRGDPTMTMAGLHDLARQLAWRGVKRVEGTLVIDGSYFADDGPPPRFDDQPDEHAGYRAPVAAASLERNAITIVIVPDRIGLGPASVRLDPPGGDYVRLEDPMVVTIDQGRTRILVEDADADERKGRGDDRDEDDDVTLEVSGQLRTDDGVYFVRRRVGAPERLFAAGMRAALAEAGIRVRGQKLGHGSPPPMAALVAERASVTLGEVLREMNKSSDNFLAETVLKTLGAELLARAAAGGGTGLPVLRPATWADGQQAIARYLTDVVGLPAASFRVENGSGLYDASQVSAHAVARVLATAHRDLRVGPELMASLSIGGVDGTLRRRLSAPAVRGRVRGKTGTLAQVSTLAGYAGVDTARPLAFAVLVNRLPPGQRGAARVLQDSIATIAVRYGGP